MPPSEQNDAAIRAAFTCCSTNTLHNREFFDMFVSAAIDGLFLLDLKISLPLAWQSLADHGAQGIATVHPATGPGLVSGWHHLPYHSAGLPYFTCGVDACTKADTQRWGHSMGPMRKSTGLYLQHLLCSRKKWHPFATVFFSFIAAIKFVNFSPT